MAFHAHVIGGVEHLLLERSAEMTHPAPAVAVPLGLRAALAILDALPRSEGDLPTLTERMDEAIRLLSAYLAGEMDGREAGGDVDFFDIWG